ncbi:Cytochrome c oxidase assembly protein cox15, partial [Entophlyctis sp. JEL0112]
MLPTSAVLHCRLGLRVAVRQLPTAVSARSAFVSCRMPALSLSPLRALSKTLTTSSSAHSLARRLVAQPPPSKQWPVALDLPSPAAVRSFTSTTLDQNAAESASAANDSVPATTSTARVVGYWYLFCAALVFAIVAVGGLTRLTEAGLPITEWNLITGMKPPRTEEEWLAELEKYKQFPEYKLFVFLSFFVFPFSVFCDSNEKKNRLNHNITLNEFKFIFYMEWGHRMLGRFIGLAFIVPGVYFAAKGYMTRSMMIRSAIVATLIGGQGVLGWYMVKSGLREELMEAKSFHGVSQYWLAAHLGSAFVIYSMMLLSGFEILRTSGKNAAHLAE